MQQKSAEGLTFFKTVLIHKKLVVVVLVAVKLKKKTSELRSEKILSFLQLVVGLCFFLFNNLYFISKKFF